MPPPMRIILTRSCLDDEELEYLGAPWEEYAHTADTLGLDVLRYVLSSSAWVVL